jgi:hypothetical protein
LGDSDITSKAEELYNILKYKSNGWRIWNSMKE